MPCRLEGNDLAIWRGASGQPHVWGDRCPHRGMRLSQGFVRGEALSCVYHGWQYGSDGGCVSIPAHPKLVPPKSICAKTYQCSEAEGLIWATLTETTDALPPLQSQTPVRTLYVDKSVAAVAHHFGSPGATLINVNNPLSATLALQCVDDGCTAVHALTSDMQDRKDVSRWLEMQRADIERAAP
jgi:phenylpropionate dioxygenase-like ring-hydroxylating dioxygenase large terminal subunit